MIKRGYTEYQMNLEDGTMLRATIEHAINVVSFVQVYANGEMDDFPISVPFDKIDEIAEIVNDITLVVKGVK